MSIGRIVGTVFGVVAALVILTILFGSWYTVDQGERGVILTNGAITETSVEPGLHFKTPIIDDLVRIDVRDHTLKWENDAAMQAYSRDQQPAVAEAAAIKARGAALRDNPALIDLTAVERWNGTLPTTIPPNGTVPFLNLVRP